MTFKEALYGSCYLHALQENKSLEKARLNGNVYLAVFAVVGIMILLMMVSWFSPAFMHRLFKAGPAGKWELKLLIAGMMLAVVVAIYCTIGSAKNYTKIIESFLQHSQDEQQSAGKVIQGWFYLLFGGFFVSLLIALYA